jgi:hypothetical protein
MRWPVEIIFEEGKGEIGFDPYETRSWLGWRHHLLLVSLAHHFLVRLRVKFKDIAPALTIYQVRLWLTSVLPKPSFDAAVALVWFGTSKNAIMSLLCLIVNPNWRNLASQPSSTLRCNISCIEERLIFHLQLKLSFRYDRAA